MTVLVHLLRGLVGGVDFAQFLVDDFVGEVVMIYWYGALLHGVSDFEFGPL